MSYDESVGSGAAICLSDGYKGFKEAMQAIDDVTSQLTSEMYCNFYTGRNKENSIAARIKHADEMRNMVRRMEQINKR